MGRAWPVLLAAAVIAAASGVSDSVLVSEAWVTDPVRRDNVDSLAVAVEEGLVLATTKGTHQLLVLRAATGHEVGRVGASGAKPYRMRRPNGIAVAGDRVLVVERDAARVRIFRLPALAPDGSFGEGDLRWPYGIAVTGSDDGSWRVWVTDDFDLSGPDDPALAQRVKEYRLEIGDRGAWTAELVRTFGDMEGDGALRVVESIAVDPEHDRLLIADEDRYLVAVYTTGGRFTGKLLGEGLLRDQPEGIALRSEGSDGIWVLTEQGPRRTTFHLYDRRSLEHVDSFSGGRTGNTDGIAVVSVPLEGFPEGALFAVHDDRAVSAFDWRHIAAAAGLEERPLPPG